MMRHIGQYCTVRTADGEEYAGEMLEAANGEVELLNAQKTLRDQWIVDGVPPVQKAPYMIIRNVVEIMGCTEEQRDALQARATLEEVRKREADRRRADVCAVQRQEAWMRENRRTRILAIIAMGAAITGLVIALLARVMR